VEIVPNDAVALGPSLLVGVSPDDPECLAAAGMLLVRSADRGASWQADGCLAEPATDLHVDPTTGAAAFVAVDGRHVTLGADGSVGAVPAVAPEEALGLRIAVDAGALYAVADDGPAALRRIEGGASTPCGDPGLPGVPAWQLDVAALPGVLLVTAPPDATGAGPQLRVGLDRCAGFVDATAPAGCGFRAAAGPVTLVASCDDERVLVLRLDALAQGWSPGPAYLAPGGAGAPRLLVEAGGARLHLVDALADPGFPAGWPVAPTTAAPAPPLEPAAPALELVNARYRRPLGLPDLGWSPVAALAARRHADYLAANGYSGLEEEDGLLGFTGVSPSDRCAAAAGDEEARCREAATDLPDLREAVSAWLQAPFHAAPFLEERSVGLAASSVAAVADFPLADGDDVGTVWDLRAEPNVADAAVRVWPAEGTAGVPTAWLGLTSPDPLAGYEGDDAQVGPALGVASPLVPVHVSLLRTADGAAVPLIADPEEPALVEQTVEPGAAFAWLFPASRLARLASYRLVLRRDDGWLRVVRFSTAFVDPPSLGARREDAAGGSAPAPGVQAARRCVVRPAVKRLRGPVGAVRFRRTGACAGVLVERRTRRGWRRVALKRRLGLLEARVAIPARVQWRARRGRVVIARGVVRIRVVAPAR